ncbi:c-type cytochrome biogenesis protein CcsB [Lampropedia puyangensis]|uniref:c-type cytochrome biogenesis protein CcsB n=1 Tax=Lampropedia puyangensis TaxID=1330072 RepID=UPI001FCE9DAB|nr:c-type cytochrome biogenesis protein CcsB [Lampropedia puyangensis]
MTAPPPPPTPALAQRTSTHGAPKRTTISRLCNAGFVLLTCAASLWTWWHYAAALDAYETALLLGSALLISVLGCNWRPLQGFAISTATLSLLAITLYKTPNGPDLQQAQNSWALQYALSSQSAILWMGVLFALATTFYWLALWQTAQRAEHSPLSSIARTLTWAACCMALTGSLVRWYESHLLGAGMGHIPISNLYEVLILFCWMTAVLYLYYEAEYAGRMRHMGALVLPLICATVGFLFWYSVNYQAHAIEPLVPALQSWWMKLHVPANFIGYGAFALAAMLAFAWLIQHHAQRKLSWTLATLWLLGIALCATPFAFQHNATNHIALYAGLLAVWVAVLVSLRQPLARRLPDAPILEELMYKTIALGFAFFTIATILGALWAAQAWGGYWSWDPKETWALIVWLNYAAWLHLRLVKGLHGPVLAWWALAGLVITTFAFLGVNLFLGGLHSYGQL